MICIMLITIVNLLYSIFCNTGRVWYDVIPNIEERKNEELFDVDWSVRHKCGITSRKFSSESQYCGEADK